MSSLKRFSDGFWSWISPRQTQQRRDKPFKAPKEKSPIPESSSQQSKRQLTQDRRQSKSQSTQREHQSKSQSSQASRIHNVSENVDFRRSQSPAARGIPWQSSSPSTNSVAFPTIEWSPDLSSLDNSINSHLPIGQNDSTEDSYDANEETIVVNSEENHEAALTMAEGSWELDLEAKFEEQRVESMAMLNDGWNLDTVLLYMLLARRAYETLLPGDWNEDFPLFPQNVFSAGENEHQAYLRALKPRYTRHGCKALLKFVELGVRVRDSVKSHSYYPRRPEGLVETYCKKYMKWAHKDAGLDQDIQNKRLFTLIDFASGMYGTPTDKLEESILYRLRKRATELLNLLRVDGLDSLESDDDEEESGLFKHQSETYIYEPPTIYGIVSSQTVVALVAYEPLSERDALRTIAFFHFSKNHYDVWNVLALAMLIVYCRNHLIKIQEALPKAIDCEVSKPEDPDL